MLQGTEDCFLQSHGTLRAPPACTAKLKYHLPSGRVPSDQVYVSTVCLDRRPNAMHQDIPDVCFNLSCSITFRSKYLGVTVHCGVDVQRLQRHC